jgi:beta-xylosidase
MSRSSLACIVAITSVAFVFFSFFFATPDHNVETSTAVHEAWASARLQAPVLDLNFPDPAVLNVDGTFYAFATNGAGQNVQAARSTDLVEWATLPDALPELGPWVQPMRGQVWAPEAIEIGGSYLMYYTARDRATNRQCIGVASSPAPEGPYRDTAGQPLVCPDGFQRAIDPHPYVDGRDLYLYYSGVCCAGPNGIFIQKLSADGLATSGEPSLLLGVNAAWEGDIAEAPTIVKRQGTYYLFYSGNDWRNHAYAVGYAICKSAIGPCTKAEENPVLATGSNDSRALGPGHQSIVKVGDDYWLFFHGWNGAVGYREGGSRVMWLQPLSWPGGKPAVGVPAN